MANSANKQCLIWQMPPGKALHSMAMSMHVLDKVMRCALKAVPTLHGMIAVKPGLTGTTPDALKLSPPAVKVAEVRLDTASGDRAPRKCLTTYSYRRLPTHKCQRMRGQLRGEQCDV